jgi:hypothetical protein
MTIRIDEVSTVVEAGGEQPLAGGPGSATSWDAAMEDQIEQWRAVVRQLVSEEMERWQRSRGDWR